MEALFAFLLMNVGASSPSSALCAFVSGMHPLGNLGAKQIPRDCISKRLTTPDREPSLLVEHVILGSNTWPFQADSMSVPHLNVYLSGDS